MQCYICKLIVNLDKFEKNKFFLCPNCFEKLLKSAGLFTLVGNVFDNYLRKIHESNMKNKTEKDKEFEKELIAITIEEDVTQPQQ